MELLQLLLLTLLFIASLLSVRFHLSTSTFKKLLPWLIRKPPANSGEISAPNKCSSTSGNARARVSPEQGEEIKQVFYTFDKNKDGFITRQELGESLKRMGISTGEDEVEQMLERWDSNGDGFIDMDEFSVIFEPFSNLRDREEGDGGGDDDGEVDLKEAFDVFDGDRDGLITVEELGMVLSALGLKEGKRVEDCKEMIRKVDVDGDGMVNFDEFKKMMRSSSGGSRLIPAF